MNTAATAIHPKVARNAYVQLAQRVMSTAQKMQVESDALTILLTAAATRPLCAKETRRVNSLYSRLDKREQALSAYLC